ncbi:uncharacterized protein CTHT_0068490 [Thermochaetoides thermophila DSM 1495]|uniref:Uncharacterized protein n=1 Tax=Chaetomium thermophilum (strain DSM 1495 / CBS 144.50 / IMI 039719) TaxID=759272 RepID=G0SH30_CHATD|nr:hypothetical protein CTHT_0068490 [Thermochaetoides thermophila DSM 1495]EGS17519.1 hypothetical protein CTHT_0068490 [Thermochaetoides thermophila DSM 1495]
MFSRFTGQYQSQFQEYRHPLSVRILVSGGRKWVLAIWRKTKAKAKGKGKQNGSSGANNGSSDQRLKNGWKTDDCVIRNEAKASLSNDGRSTLGQERGGIWSRNVVEDAMDWPQTSATTGALGRWWEDIEVGSSKGGYHHKCRSVRSFVLEEGSLEDIWFKHRHHNNGRTWMVSSINSDYRQKSAARLIPWVYGFLAAKIMTMRWKAGGGYVVVNGALKEERSQKGKDRWLELLFISLWSISGLYYPVSDPSVIDQGSDRKLVKPTGQRNPDEWDEEVELQII